jgi:hypothetical protein
MYSDIEEHSSHKAPAEMVSDKSHTEIVEQQGDEYPRPWREKGAYQGGRKRWNIIVGEGIVKVDDKLEGEVGDTLPVGVAGASSGMWVAWPAATWLLIAWRTGFSMASSLEGSLSIARDKTSAIGRAKRLPKYTY